MKSCVLSLIFFICLLQADTSTDSSSPDMRSTKNPMKKRIVIDSSSEETDPLMMDDTAKKHIKKSTTLEISRFLCIENLNLQLGTFALYL